MSVNKEIINALTFGEQQKNESNDIQCLKCERSYEFPQGKDDYLAHLYLTHRLVISDVQDIAQLEDYLKFWIEGFKGELFKEFSVIKLLNKLFDPRTR